MATWDASVNVLPAWLVPETAGAGTVGFSGGRLVISTAVLSGDPHGDTDTGTGGAIVRQASPIDRTRTQTFDVKFRVTAIGTSSVISPIQVQVGATHPTGDAVLANRRIFFNFAPASFAFEYYDGASVDTAWDGTDHAWESIVGSRPSGTLLAPLTVGATDYVARLETTPTQWRSTVLASDGTTVVYQAAWVNWSVFGGDDGSTQYWIVTGDPYNNYFYGTVEVSSVSVDGLAFDIGLGVPREWAFDIGLGVPRAPAVRRRGILPIPIGV